jgi:hypothetical protein
MSRNLSLIAIFCVGAAACSGGTATNGGSGGSIGGSTTTTTTTTSSSTTSSSTTGATHGTTGATTATHGTSGATTSGTTGTHGTTGAATTSGTTGETTGNETTSGTTGTHGTTGATGTTGETTGNETTSGTTGTHGTTGATGTTGETASGTTGTGTTSGTTGSNTTGGTTGACVSQTEFVVNVDFISDCMADSDCDCGLECMTDPAFTDPNSLAQHSVCEIPCTSNADCTNAASICTANATHVDTSTGNTCTVNYCGDAGAGVPPPGTACTAVNGTGTCVPQDQTNPPTTPDLLICLPNGSLTTSCTLAVNDEDPYFTSGGNPGGPYVLSVPASFPITVSSFCGAGNACDFNADAGPACETLCHPDGGVGGCSGVLRCLPSDQYDPSWGFCGLCNNSGDACRVDSDCCPGTCQIDNTCL